MSGFNGEFSLYSIYDLDTPLFTCTVLDSLPFSAIVTMDGDLFVVMLRSKDIQKKPFTLTITGEAGSIEIPSSLLPAAYAIYVSPYYLSHEASHPVALVEWNAGENGTLTIKNPYSGYPFYSRSTSIPVWSPVLLETATIYSLSNTGGNLTLVLGTNVHRWGANESFRFYVDDESVLHIYPCPVDYSVAELLYKASNVGGGIFTLGLRDGDALQFTPRLSKKTYYGGCFANGDNKLTFEHSAGDETVWMYHMGNYHGRYENSPDSHTQYPYLGQSYVNIMCEGDEVPVSFESSLTA